jgi:hypothetical protein
MLVEAISSVSSVVRIFPDKRKSPPASNFPKHRKRPIMYRGMKSSLTGTGLLATAMLALVFVCVAQFSAAQAPAA